MSHVENKVLNAIKERRSITRFKQDDVPNETLEAILEAGRWAPSWANTQPWKFIIVKDAEVKHKLTELSSTITGVGIEEAPVVIVVVVDPSLDAYHYVEDGAAATQNMSLAAHSLGLSSFWVGVYDIKNKKKTSEDRIKQLLGIPESNRIISLLPIGKSDLTITKKRKQLSEIVHRESFGK